MQKKILLVGGGGHCKSVIDVLIATRKYSDIGVIDLSSNIGKKILTMPIIGCDDDLPQLFQNGYHNAFVSIGDTGDNRLRVKLFETLEKIGFILPNIIDPSAIISPSAILGNGIFVGKNAVINADAIVGKGSIINTSVVVEHDCVIKDFVHVAPGSVLCGGVQIGTSTLIGANSVVKQQLTIGSNTIVGLGSTVISNLKDNIVAYGNPCREVLVR